MEEREARGKEGGEMGIASPLLQVDNYITHEYPDWAREQSTSTASHN
jgi:hypothetical protein